MSVDCEFVSSSRLPPRCARHPELALTWWHGSQALDQPSKRSLGCQTSEASRILIFYSWIRIFVDSFRFRCQFWRGAFQACPEERRSETSAEVFISLDSGISCPLRGREVGKLVGSQTRLYSLVVSLVLEDKRVWGLRGGGRQRQWVWAALGRPEIAFPNFIIKVHD